MKRITNTLVGVFAVVLLFALSIPAIAQSPYDITIQAGDEVAVPGHLLSPGHYSLKRVDYESPNTYRLMDEDTMQVVGVFHVIPDTRSVLEETAVTLSAPDAAGLRMIQAWYPSGGLQGYQFVYSNKDLQKLDQLALSQQQPTGSAAGQP